MRNPDVEVSHHSPTGSVSYVVSDPATGKAAVIDPVLEVSVVSGRDGISCIRIPLDSL